MKWHGDTFQKAIEKKAQDALLRKGFSIERDAKKYTTVQHVIKTGRLKSSISTNWTGSGMTRGKVEAPAKTEDGVGKPSGAGFEVVVGTNVEYAIYNEFGTIRMRARPYLRPAFHKHANRSLEYYL